ncbi:MAG: hypothetical protein RXR19_04680 [Nitrososphaeria archaeon]|jgi:hypothetical protein
MNKSDVIILLGFIFILVGFMSFVFAGMLYASNQSFGYAFSFFIFPFPVIFIGGKPAYLVSVTAEIMFIIFIIFFIIYVLYIISAIRELKK